MQNANLPTEPLTLKQVAKHLRVHIATVYRWTLRGVRGRRLKSFLVGGRRYVDADELAQFLSPHQESRQNVVSRRSEHAQEHLRSFGISRPTKGKR